MERTQGVQLAIERTTTAGTKTCTHAGSEMDVTRLTTVDQISFFFQEEKVRFLYIYTYK